jgi:hypothetical protein
LRLPRNEVRGQYSAVTRDEAQAQISIFSDYIGFWGGLRYPPKEAETYRLCSQLL